MRPAEAVSKREPKVSLEEKNAICPASIRYGQDGSAFDYTRRNINQTSVVYYCKHERKCKCKAKLLLDRDKRTGIVDETTKKIDGPLTMMLQSLKFHVPTTNGSRIIVDKSQV